MVVATEDIEARLNAKLNSNPEISPVYAALQILLDFMNNDNSGTVQELSSNLKKASLALSSTKRSPTGIRSACELFLRFVTLTTLDDSDIAESKRKLAERGGIYLENVAHARSKIAAFCVPFIVDDCKVLVHSNSRVVKDSLLKASEIGRRFKVYVTESAPDYSGKELHAKLRKSGIKSTIILDSAVAYVMEKVDMVLVGAEGIVESGGIINKIGSCQIAMCAKLMNKPVYVLAESTKFIRMFPLNQRDLPDNLKFPGSSGNEEDFDELHPLIDYTPPQYIRCLFTDLGVLTPSAVSDELIKLYM